jgi:DNA-binding CsgD family transcriptional regulator
MKENIAIKNILSHHADMQEICTPFFKKNNLNILNMIRVDDEGRSAFLCDNYHWMKNYFINGYQHTGACENDQSFRKEGHFLWSAFSKNDPIVDYSRSYFNIEHGVTLVKKTGDNHDFFNFGLMNAHPGDKDRLTRILPELETFIKEFYDKAGKLLQAAELSPIISHPETPRPAEPVKAMNSFHLGPAFDYQYLTHKELECLQWMVRGKTLPEIGLILGMSERTAEKHVENIKRKLKCRTQCEIGYFVAKTSIDRCW